jgi:hypothetical protein
VSNTTHNFADCSAGFAMTVRATVAIKVRVSMLLSLFVAIYADFRRFLQIFADFRRFSAEKITFL